MIPHAVRPLHDHAQQLYSVQLICTMRIREASARRFDCSAVVHNPVHGHVREPPA
jgi:hypothetical protein